MTEWMLRLHAHDRRVLLRVVGRRHPRLDRWMRALTRLGDAAVTIGITLVLLLWPDEAGQSAGRHAAIALVGSHLVVQVLKRVARRVRPQLPVGMEALIRAPDRFSFPSGHAASSLSVALGLAGLLTPPAGAAMVLLALLVGLSRCYLGVHYPGDVVVGWGLAVAGAGGAGLLL